MEQNTDDLLENEWYIVRHSGETPEIAFNSAIYFLSKSKDGPKMSLTEEQVACLKNGASERFREIVLRDLQHANVDKPIYRGIARSIVNYQRYKKFCTRQNIHDPAIQTDAAQTLIEFLAVEAAELENTSRTTVINCSFRELSGFAEELQVSLGTYQEIMQTHCK